MNSKTFKPAIIVIAFNRAGSLKRLLQSLDSAHYDSQEVELIVSVDFDTSKANEDVRQIAEQFDWRHGTKRTIIHDVNLGLRSHVLACGDLVEEYGSVILLEDDLSVGPEFYRFTQQALNFSDSSDQIGGVSLYNHKTNFICRLPFTPLYDGYDNYYLQIASSWGQAWTRTQWKSFRDWYRSLDDRNIVPSPLERIPQTAGIHSKIANWPHSSWLKYFIWFLEEQDRYFLYPRISHTTCHGDSGTHVSKSTHVWQVPIAHRTLAHRFSDLEESLAVYDSFFELKPEKLKVLVPNLKDYDLDVDAFGTKQHSDLRRKWVLTSQACDSADLRFRLERKPFCANYSTPSADSSTSTFSVARPNEISGPSRLTLKQHRNLEYFFGAFPMRTLLKNAIRYFIQKRS